jgi:putative membrane protein
MIVRWLLAAAHLLGLGIGLGAIWGRRRALLEVPEVSAIHRVLDADTWWGIAAAIWISTGLVRAFGPFEKGRDYYLHNHWFLTKMVCLGLILALEIAPMVTFIGWRQKLARHESVDTLKARLFARISGWQTILLLVMVLAASAMARGFGTPAH